MDIGQSFILAVKSLMASKMRALLTMLGIIIGVSAVILISGMGEGLTAHVEETFTSMGSNIVTAMALRQTETKYVDLDKLSEFAMETEGIKYYAPYTQTSATAKFENEDASTTVYGTNEDYASIRDRGIASGRNIQYLDVEREQRVCVVGSHVIEELFGKDAINDELIGKHLKINGTTFKIVGIMEEKASNMAGGDDDMILIPYTVAQKVFNIQYVNMFYFTYENGDYAEAIIDKIDRFFYNIYGNADYYFIMDAQSMMEEMYEMLDTITSILVAIAAISLLVGGVGIMNIMLVSVTERTKEIGIRKAIGANKFDVLSQFVIEAVTTSVIGGTIGIILGIFFTNVASVILGIEGKVTFGAVAIAVGVSSLIGILFGYMPAKKAADMHPIDALRHE
ncbi:MAG: ABC transporter permease [Clostridia bacterium]|nr:ABC transporter permease [Clostridia bacterium]